MILGRDACKSLQNGISSLGSSFMLKNGINMGIGDKVILSAVIGGTAEALGAVNFPMVL